MPGENEHVSVAHIALAFDAAGFDRIHVAGKRAFWEYGSDSGAAVVLDESRDWVLWSDIRDQLVDRGFPTKAIEDYLDGAK